MSARDGRVSHFCKYSTGKDYNRRMGMTRIKQEKSQANKEREGREKGGRKGTLGQGEGKGKGRYPRARGGEGGEEQGGR